MKITMGLTHNCNLSCKYCYAGVKSMREMSFETSKKIVDFGIISTPPEENLDFSFFGGEPLLCFKLMKRIVEYIDSIKPNYENIHSINITTNGILLTESILTFIKKYKINLCISIDGPSHVHNLNRCYSDGQGSFRKTFRKLILALKILDDVQVNAVYGPDTIDFLPETLEFFSQFDISGIHLNPNIVTGWDIHSYPKLYKNFKKVADFYIECYQHDHEITLNIIDSKILLFLKGGYDLREKCSMGEKEWGFAPSGNIYPCERFIGDDNDFKFLLGNIHTGLNETSRCSLLKHRGNSNKKCVICENQEFCMNWCGCTNYFLSGHTDLVGEMMCENEKAIIQASKHVLIELKNNQLFLDHFFGYIHESQQSLV
ncbi:MAG: radical SAM protein [Candidatus Hodarchaeota archaeon]